MSASGGFEVRHRGAFQVRCHAPRVKPAWLQMSSMDVPWKPWSAKAANAASSNRALVRGRRRVGPWGNCVPLTC